MHLNTINIYATSNFSSVEPSILLHTCDIIIKIEHLSLDINNSSIHSHPSSWQGFCETGRRKTWSTQFQAYFIPPFIFLITVLIQTKKEGFLKILFQQSSHGVNGWFLPDYRSWCKDNLHQFFSIALNEKKSLYFLQRAQKSY